MMVVGCCIYYQESPGWLAAGMASFAPLCDAFVYVDGGYALYPGALTQPASAIDSAITIEEQAAALHKTLIHYRPALPFMGNEVEKRQFSLDLAKTLPGVDGDSWFVIFDSDYFARKVSGDIKQKLEETDRLVAENWLYTTARYQDDLDAGGPDWTQINGGSGGGHPIRNLFRNIPDLHIGPAHYVYSGLDPDTGELGYLWGQPSIHQPYANALDLTAFLRVEHRRHARIAARNAAADEFYKRRDSLGIEALTTGTLKTRGLDGKWADAGTWNQP